MVSEKSAGFYYINWQRLFKANILKTVSGKCIFYLVIIYKILNNCHVVNKEKNIKMFKTLLQLWFDKVNFISIFFLFISLKKNKLKIEVLYEN